MKYKAVLFDMDGTTLNTLGDLTDAVNHTMRTFGLPELDENRCAHLLGNGARHLIRGAVPENITGEEFEKTLAFYVDYYDSHCRIKTAPYDGVIDAMNALKTQGIRMAVISNKPDGAVQQLSEEFFTGLLDISVGESERVRRKPNPDAVLWSISSLGLEKQDCVYVGDTEVDLKTAENAGIDSIAVTWGFRSVEELQAAGAKTIVSSASELLEKL